MFTSSLFLLFPTCEVYMDDYEVIKATPPIGVSTLSVLGVPLSDWVYIVTIIYVLVQMYILIYKTFYKREEEKDKK